MVIQIRAKLYRLTEVKKTGGGAAAESLKKKDDDAAEKKPNGEATPPQVRRDWVECGVGPAKILVAKSGRR